MERLLIVSSVLYRLSRICNLEHKANSAAWAMSCLMHSLGNSEQNIKLLCNNLKIRERIYQDSVMQVSDCLRFQSTPSVSSMRQNIDAVSLWAVRASATPSVAQIHWRTIFRYRYSPPPPPPPPLFPPAPHFLSLLAGALKSRCLKLWGEKNWSAIVYYLLCKWMACPASGNHASRQCLTFLPSFTVWQTAEALEDTLEARQTAAIVAELSVAMQSILEVRA